MRDLSLKGKRTVINILAAACLWYPAYVYHMPDWAIQNSTMRYGLFSGETKRTQSNVTLPCCRLTKGGGGEGGLQIMDLVKSPKLLRCLRLPGFLMRTVLASSSTS